MVRQFVFIVSAVAALVSCTTSSALADDHEADMPNVVLILADDLGWGDVGFHDNDVIITPHLDGMAATGLELTRFYTSSSICSPTRASLLTGRHPYRTGIWAAHTNGMRTAEETIAELLEDEGYRTGFFGKWHLGHLEAERANGNNRGFYSPPWIHGYQETFATQSAVPTYNPTENPVGWRGREAGPWKTDGLPYLTGQGEKVTENLEGDDSRIIMDRAVPFIQDAVEQDKPFFATIWFHTPHEPVYAGPRHLAMYEHLDSLDQRHFYGAITAMDEQIGRLIAHLEQLGVSENTFILFTSDNGASGPAVRQGVASSGPFRGTKHTHYEGGIRVPTVAYWPETIEPGQNAAVSSTVDFLPTVAEIVGIDWETLLDDRPIDGVSLKNVLLEGEETEERYVVSGYRRLNDGYDGIALIDGRWKLHRHRENGELTLFDLEEDPYETTDLSQEKPELVAAMAVLLSEWEDDVERSAMGADYPY